jgi:hypothetical protein
MSPASLQQPTAATERRGIVFDARGDVLAFPNVHVIGAHADLGTRHVSVTIRYSCPRPQNGDKDASVYLYQGTPRRPALAYLFRPRCDGEWHVRVATFAFVPEFSPHRELVMNATVNSRLRQDDSFALAATYLVPR